MTILIVDGPNKSGKSTLIANTVKELSALSIDVKVRHWGPLSTDDREYSDPLEQDTQHSGVVIWDRCWSSEYVYGQLLNRQHRRLTNDPWLGEFLHRRTIVGNGKCFILVPKNGMNAPRLDETDAGYSDNNLRECQLFIQYALRFKWHGLINDYTAESLANNTAKLVAAATTGNGYAGQRHIVGKNNNVLIIGSKHLDDPFPGGWLPFSSSRLIAFARLFGDAGLCATWCDVEAVGMLMLSRYKHVLCVGKRAYDTVMNCYRSKPVSLVYVPIPGGEYNEEQATTALRNMQWDESVVKFGGLLEGDWNATKYL